jgi:biotin transport system substrate-specific component
MQNTLVANIWPQISTSWVNKALVVLLGSIALIISAKLKVPFYPVPMTMQVFVVLAIGLILGFRLGVATVLLYLAEGALSLPVFAGTPERGLGLAYMMGPTGGYLLGYLFAVAVVGWLAEWGWAKRWLEAVAVAFLGLLLIYIPGLLWLGTVLGWDKPIFEFGFAPFIAGDAVKVLLAALLVTGIWQWRGAEPRS